MSALDLDAIRRTRGVDLAVWPPRYDPAYRPPPDAQHWLPEVECAAPEARDGLILGEAPRAGALRVGAKPVLPAEVGGGGRLPRHAPHPRRPRRGSPSSPRTSSAPRRPRIRPSATTSASPADAVARIHGTSGTTGRPTVFGIGRGRLGRGSARPTRGSCGASGIRPGDRVLIARSSASTWARGARSPACERLGATTFPFGAGAPGKTAGAPCSGRARSEPTRVLRDAVLRAPLRRDAPGARASTRGASGFRILFFSGEPGRRASRARSG